MGFAPYFQHSGTPAATDRTGYLRIRVSDDVKENGYIAVYLVNGTQLVVAAREILQFEADDR